ncbi:hypothetical protein ABL78_2336 [Leptomonas seymouri]|uniref:Uncharacterized protein n=1 Tax=Leptomonas seymouri TaxID=5684 RepID=A0A0N1ILM4_LEPSE|nr:hypothetical protein ABL78_2336 [Leptomonas seymouri]|eukprot:KPI88524.1 hypothetical protein ABL78_2336 [Leptomonas seymouri]
MSASASPASPAPSATGQRVTLSAKQATTSEAADPASAEVIRASLFPERVVMLRSTGDVSPGWNDVVVRDCRRKKS